MKKNTRFVLIDCKEFSYAIYDGKVELARYLQEDPNNAQYLTKDEIEYYRTADYKVKA